LSLALALTEERIDDIRKAWQAHFKA